MLFVRDPGQFSESIAIGKPDSHAALKYSDAHTLAVVPTILFVFCDAMVVASPHDHLAFGDRAAGVAGSDWVQSGSDSRGVFVGGIAPGRGAGLAVVAAGAA